MHFTLLALNYQSVCRVADDKVVKISDYSIAQLYSEDFYLSNDNISLTRWWALEILDIEEGSTPAFNHKTDCVSYRGWYSLLRKKAI